MIPLRFMLPDGENLFREFIYQVRNNPEVEKPDLNREPYSREFSPQIMIDDKIIFKSKLELAQYLDNIFREAHISREDVIRNRNLWTWLAYIWWKQLTNNCNNIKERDEHYICTEPSNYRRYYTHLVAAPYILYSLYNLPISMLFLYNPPWKINDFTERVAANQFLISHRNIVEVIYSLYFDEKKQRPKKGSTSPDAPGNIRRFIKVLRQFELTYDIYSMTPQQIIEILPEEFKKWLNKE